MSRLSLVVFVVVASFASSASAAILCKARSGALFVREKCKRRESEATLLQVPGLAGPAGRDGVNGQPGATGPAGPLTGDLPSGVTLRGSFLFGHSDLSPSYPGPVSGSLDFGGFRLSSTPAAHVIDLAQASTTDCPGTAVAPEAAPGVLCVYVADRQGASKITILQAGDETFANGIDRTFTDATDVARATSGNISRVGAHVLVSATGASSVVSVRGTWAVTAP